ncbi:MAG: hypothetical protein NDI94_04330 [Candidatus Woesearchaeota archaeon]|nr:hypothetical protein [Candidatus Woesearchaeota archaeon]
MKKGQAAMEFLMTYGWAILVVIAAIAALAYFGVLDPGKLLPERCQSSPGMDCISKKPVVTTSGVTIALRNNLGGTVEVTDVAGATCDTATGGAAGTTGAITTGGSFSAFNVSNNQVFRLQLDCTLTADNKYEDTVTITYKELETGLTPKITVDVRGKVTV